MDIWSILWPFDIFYGHLIYLMVTWYIFSRFGMFYQKNLATLDVNSGSTPAAKANKFLSGCRNVLTAFHCRLEPF
jgi:hypothetical protein